MIAEMAQIPVSESTAAIRDQATPGQREEAIDATCEHMSGMTDPWRRQLQSADNADRGDAGRLDKYFRPNFPAFDWACQQRIDPFVYHALSRVDPGAIFRSVSEQIAQDSEFFQSGRAAGIMRIRDTIQRRVQPARQLVVIGPVPQGRDLR